jgi:hypothetical protein
MKILLEISREVHWLTRKSKAITVVLEVPGFLMPVTTRRSEML